MSTATLTADTAPASLFHVTTQYNSNGSVASTNTYAGSLSGFYITLAAAGEKAVGSIHMSCAISGARLKTNSRGVFINDLVPLWGEL